MDLFNIILSCISDGNALNIVEKIWDNNNVKECKQYARKYLKDWYLDDTKEDYTIYHCETELKIIAFDPDTSCTEYINNLEMYVWQISKIDENWTDEKNVQNFKKRFDNPD